MRHVSDEERRARLAVRHALSPDHHVASPHEAARAVVALHATEPTSVHLSCWARVADLELADVDRALHEQRTLVKQLGMRRTLFAVPPELLPAVWAGPANRVARSERRSIVKDVAAAGLHADPSGWLDGVRAQALQALAASQDGLTAAELRRAVPDLDVHLPASSGQGSAVSRVLRHLGLTADAVRTTTTGDWRTLRPRWLPTARWIDVAADAEPDAGWRDLVRLWLERFGPGTEQDVVWWLGATKGIVRQALTELDATAVTLDRGETGWLLPGDLDEPPEPEHWTALLPVLDPTTMGWKQREFSLGPHRDQLFDRSGNGGSTAWVDGRIVGAWVQDDTGAVELRLLERVSARARRSLDEQARRLTATLAGVRIVASVGSPAMRTT